MVKRSILSGLMGLLFCVFNVTANAGLILSAGQLVGATDVEVDGQLYTVTFQGGTCIDAYDGCDENADFPFATPDLNNAAAQALLDQVFVDGPDGLFDSNPSLTTNCTSTSACFAIWPTALNPSDSSFAFLFGVLNVTGEPDPIAAPAAWPIDESININGGGALTWAIWTKKAAVPAPGALGLLVIGLVWAGIRRRTANLNN